MARTVKRNLPVTLTSEEIDVKATKLAAQVAYTEKLRDQKRETNSALKEQIDESQAKVSELSRQITLRTEERQVLCTLVKDFKAGMATVTRNDTGEVVEERPLADDEYQADLLPEAEGSADDSDAFDEATN